MTPVDTRVPHFGGLGLSLGLNADETVSPTQPLKFTNIQRPFLAFFSGGGGRVNIDTMST